MKVILFVFAATLAVVSSEMSMEHFKNAMLSNRQDLRTKLDAQHFKQKLDRICPNYPESKYDTYVNEADTCLKNIYRYNETMCSLMDKYFAKCFKPLETLMEECFPQNLRFIPGFVRKMILAATDKMCTSDGEHLFELMNACALNMNPSTERCLRRIKAKSQELERKSDLSQTDLCDFMSSLRGCGQSHLNAACGNEKTKEAFLNLYDALMSPCSSGKNVEMIDTNYL